MGLLLALNQVVRETDDRTVSLFAVTIDHALRSEAADEAKGVAALCASVGIPHHIRRWNEVKPTTGISAASRLARYRLVGSVADEIAADMVVTAHTRGDQRETIAMRAERSTRHDNLGLAGMADAVLYGGRHWIVRPFLDCERQDIRDFLLAASHTWFDDPSNLDRKYERVRAREALSNEPDVAACDMAERRTLLSSKAADWISAHARSAHLSLVTVSTAGLGEDVAVLRHALSALAAVIGGRSFSLAAQSMDRVMSFVLAAKPGRMTAGRVVFDLRREGLYLMRECRDLPSALLEGKCSLVWDNRFLISNTGGQSVTIRAAGAGMHIEPSALFAEAPAGIAKRAVSSLPCAEREGSLTRVEETQGLSLRAVLQPYDLFLPRFELALANTISAMLGRGFYPQPPV